MGAERQPYSCWRRRTRRIRLSLSCANNATATRVSAMANNHSSRTTLASTNATAEHPKTRSHRSHVSRRLQTSRHRVTVGPRARKPDTWAYHRGNGTFQYPARRHQKLGSQPGRVGTRAPRWDRSSSRRSSFPQVLAWSSRLNRCRAGRGWLESRTKRPRWPPRSAR